MDPELYGMESGGQKLSDFGDPQILRKLAEFQAHSYRGNFNNTPFSRFQNLSDWYRHLFQSPQAVSADPLMGHNPLRDMDNSMFDSVMGSGGQTLRPDQRNEATGQLAEQYAQENTGYTGRRLGSLADQQGPVPRLKFLAQAPELRLNADSNLGEFMSRYIAAQMAQSQSGPEYDWLRKALGMQNNSNLD